MEYLIVASWDSENRPNSTNRKKTEQEAQLLVQTLIDNGNFPDAFYVKHPGVNERFITVNPADKSISVDTAAITEHEDERKWAAIRAERKIRFEAVDDAARDAVWGEIDATKKNEWKAYRRALRDLPQTYSNPDDVVWPVPPG